MHTELRFTFPYAEYVQAGLEVVPDAIRRVDGAERMSDYLIAKIAVNTLRRIAPTFSPSKGVPWDVFAKHVLINDYRNFVNRGHFVSEEEIAVALLDPILEKAGL